MPLPQLGAGKTLEYDSIPVITVAGVIVPFRPIWLDWTEKRAIMGSGTPTALVMRWLS